MTSTTDTGRSTTRFRRIARTAAAATLALGVQFAGGGPADAATKLLFSSPGNFGISACRTSTTAVKVTVHNYSSLPIYRVSMRTIYGNGTYVEYIPGYYASKTQYWPQKIDDGRRYVHLRRTNTSKEVAMGSFYIAKAYLPYC